VQLTVVARSAAATLTFIGAAAPTATSGHVFAAFDHHGHVARALTVLARTKGTCRKGSLADSRVDAWRCHSTNVVVVGGKKLSNLFDPCFAVPSNPNVVCARAPWSNRVVLLRLTKPLPRRLGKRGEALPAGAPWGIVTTTGRRCTLITGATTAISGLRINYACSGGAALAGDVDRGKPTWTIFFERTRHSTQFTLVSIRSAWW
jgi:hypothetical protein